MRLETLSKCLAGEPRKYQIRTGRYGLLSSEKMYFIFFIAGIFLLYFIVLLVFLPVFYCIACIFTLFVLEPGGRRVYQKKMFFIFYFLKKKNFPVKSDPSNYRNQLGKNTSNTIKYNKKI